jgi:hypothetical protein
MTGTVARAAALLAPLLLGVTACGGSGDGSANTTTSEVSTTSAAPSTTEPLDEPDPVGGLVASVGTNRLYAPNRELGLGVENVGDEAVTIQAVQLDSELFEPVPAAARQLVLPPRSRRLVLPVPYGTARCGDDAREAFAATIVVDGGQELSLPVAEDHPGAIGRLHRRECAAADVAERAEIRLGDEWEADGITITGRLHVTKRGHGAPVTLVDAVGNVIFTLRLGGDGPPFRVTDDEPDIAVPVTISADRCDPHAVAEFKRPLVLLSWFAVGDGAPTPVEIVATGGARQAFEALIASCSS